MDALLPADRRYTSLKFRRVARMFHATRLDYADAAELVAFVVTVGGVARAKYIFHWTTWTVEQARLLVDHLGATEDVQRMVSENEAAVTRDDGLKCLRAMQDGGWRKGSVPRPVHLAFQDMRDAGMSMPRIAAATGVALDQVRTICHPDRFAGRFARVPLAGLVAS
jgi:hypothetical protein